MPYPEPLVRPMREELTRLGVEELTTPDEVDAALGAPGTTLLCVNSVCGCAAANARPAVALAMRAGTQPDRYVTVFAGQDMEATSHVRQTHLAGIPPSSPFFALLKDGEPVYLIERRHIEGRSASAIATDLVEAFEAYCGTDAGPGDGPERPSVETAPRAGMPSTFRSIM